MTKVNPYPGKDRILSDICLLFSVDYIRVIRLIRDIRDEFSVNEIHDQLENSKSDLDKLCYNTANLEQE